MRYKIDFSYNGREYCGYQLQKDKPTVAKCLNETLSDILKVNINVTASGRTDSGVSAISQVGHFDYDGELPKGIVGRLNYELPDSIKVAQISPAPNFHARYDAKKKVYTYKFYDGPENAFYNTFAYHIYKLDFIKAQKCMAYLEGEHDFSAFCATGGSVKDKIRKVYYARLTKDDDLYTFEICGNGFLYNMVRIIAGTIVKICSSDLPAEHMKAVIASCDRHEAGPTLPAFPLTLKKVIYD